jgi:hypothetical protein
MQSFCTFRSASQRLRVSNNTFPSNYAAFNASGVTRLISPPSGASIELPQVPRRLSVRLERTQLLSSYNIPVSVFSSQVSDDSYVVAAFGGVGGNVTISQDRALMQFTSKSQCVSSCAFSVLFYKPGGGILTSTVDVQVYDAPTASVAAPSSSASSAPTSTSGSPSSSQPSAKSVTPTSAATSVVSRILVVLSIGSFSSLVLFYTI